MIEAAQYKTASYVVRLGNAVTNYRNVKMQEYGLTSAQGDTMRAILHAPGITAAELKKQLGLSQYHRGRRSGPAGHKRDCWKKSWWTGMPEK